MFEQDQIRAQTARRTIDDAAGPICRVRSLVMLATSITQRTLEANTAAARSSTAGDTPTARHHDSHA